MFITLSYLFMIFLVLIYPQGVLASECYRSCMRRKHLTFMESLVCWIPLINLATIRKSFYNSYKLHSATLLLIFSGIVYRTLAILVLWENSVVVLSSVYIMLVVMIMIWALSAYTFYDTAKCIRQGGITKLLCVFVPPLGAYLVSNKIRPYMRSVKDELEGTFDGKSSI